MTDGATTLSSVFNLINTIMGAGILALPYAFRCAGLGVGTIILLVVWAASSHSFVLLSQCAEMSQSYSFLAIAKRTYGRAASVTSEGAIFLYTIGNLIVRIIIIGNCCQPVLERYGGESRYTSVASITLIVTVSLLCDY